MEENVQQRWGSEKRTNNESWEKVMRVRWREKERKGLNERERKMTTEEYKGILQI